MNTSNVIQAGVRPLVGIGLTMHNRAAFLQEAVDSWLAQSYSHFRLVLVDDGSTDGTGVIGRAYAQRDSRVLYVRLEERQGMVAAWRVAFGHATSTGAPYFAWGSDHDRWHPDWLRALVETLDAHPDVVLAYPLTQRIDPAGEPIAKSGRQFETFGIADRARRWSVLSRSDSAAAGDIVYGLMRTAAVRESGVFRDVLCPDRLLIAELTLRGQIRQIPQSLWFRRCFTAGSVDRQRVTLFGPAARPPSALTPPWFMHARSLWTTYGRVPVAPLGMSKTEVRRLIAEYASSYAWRHYSKSSVQRGFLTMLGWPRWVYKRTKHLVLHAVYHALMIVRHRDATR